jgi:hypothetical protein
MNNVGLTFVDLPDSLSRHPVAVWKMAEQATGFNRRDLPLVYPRGTGLDMSSIKVFFKTCQTDLTATVFRRTTDAHIVGGHMLQKCVRVSGIPADTIQSLDEYHVELACLRVGSQTLDGVPLHGVARGSTITVDACHTPLKKARLFAEGGNLRVNGTLILGFTR